MARVMSGGAKAQPSDVHRRWLSWPDAQVQELQSSKEHLQQLKVKLEDAQQMHFAELEEKRQLEEGLKQGRRHAEAELQRVQEDLSHCHEQLQAQRLVEQAVEAKDAALDEVKSRVRQLEQEAKMQMAVVEQQQVTITEQKAQLTDLSRQLDASARETVDASEAPDESRLREGLRMAIEELDTRQVQFCLEKQRLTGALEESRRAVLQGWAAAAPQASAFDSARVAGLEQQLAMERQRCIDQAVDLQRLERELTEQLEAKARAEEMKQIYQQQAGSLICSFVVSLLRNPTDVLVAVV
ncbi:unnamed protein product [Effrenium voratum]|nr:unnamed protein product [Effrenium voratum]